MSSVTFERQRAPLADVVAIPVTPFTEDGSVDRETCRLGPARPPSTAGSGRLRPPIEAIGR